MFDESFYNRWWMRRWLITFLYSDMCEWYKNMFYPGSFECCWMFSV